MSTVPKRCIAAALLTIALGACGGGAITSTAATTPTVNSQTASPALDGAGPHPSASTRMICAAEGKEDIATAVGTDTARPLSPHWSDHLYSCNYDYGAGRVLTLSVRELANGSETIAYFDALGAKLGRGAALHGLGQGAFQTRNGSTVVRKDYRVLLVDDAHLPVQFGKPVSPRKDVSLSVAATIIGCWTGA